jgi:uncharacterized membrane protein YcaP (DUF421 family)
MELVIRAAVIYAFLLLILRISGKRQFSQITTFDFVLLLIISEAVSQGLYGSADYSLTASLLLVTTLVAMDIALSLVKHRFRFLEDALESKPTQLIQDGRLLESNLSAERIDKSDILSAARITFGIESLLEVRHAILERDGSISIIPNARRFKVPASEESV